MAKVKADAQVTFAAAGHNDVINATQRVGDQFQRTSKQVNTTTKAMHQQFRFMRGGLGQVGHQIQDVAVQLQMGQNAMLVFGQQGSQIASLFGPHGAIIGAVLAVGAAIAVAFTGEVKEATDRAKELHEEAMNLADGFHELTGAIREQAEAKLEDQYNALIAEIAGMQDSLALLNAQLQMTQGGMNFAGQSAEDLRDKILDVRAELQRKAEDLQKVSDALDGYTEKNEDAAESEKQLAELRRETRRQIWAQLDEDREKQKEQLEWEKAFREEGLEHLLDVAKREKKARDKAETEAKARTRMRQKLDLAVVTSASGVVDQLMQVMDKESGAYKAAFAARQAMAVAQAIISANVAATAALEPPPIGLGPTAGAPYAAIIKAMGYASAGIIAGQTLASFEGGGMTPRGIRSGGMDGKGGMLAVLHPNEKVTDMEKGGGAQPVNVTFNIQANDAKGFDELLAKRRGMIVNMVNRAMNERGKRGVVA